MKMEKGMDLNGFAFFVWIGEIREKILTDRG